MNYCKTLIIALALAAATPAAAQFTIPRNAGRQNEMQRRIDSLRRVEVNQSPDEVFSPARELARKLARRKERNTTELNAKLSVQQTQFENWASGGENTFSALSSFFFRHQHKRARFGQESRVDAKYGMNYIEHKMFKNQDVFQLNSLTTWSINKAWSYSFDAELRSQFSVGYKSRTDRTRMSNLMAPGYFKVSGGFVYKLSPWTINMSPVGGSATFMWDEQLSARGLNGVPKGDRSKWQMGPSLRIIYEKAFAQNKIKVRSEAYSFSNLKTAPTARWETKCDIQATKFISTTLYSFLVYDKAANTPRRDHIQYQYSIAVGLSYTFKNK